ncbi:extracellular solute-binding protein [Spongiibacter nanhainus]|uniref:Extracellular solute-binding protein n=1 Tax=Spongiibacter nanhainus TaxID=2794344 RepID=A0A7T4UR67_9GAMM|nr:extracellular solute-binding protein [Spongiibacter nanhainus]QQD18050.1 extracellular solute-binding protein [Spongiibacter nanhainus]
MRGLHRYLLILFSALALVACGKPSGEAEESAAAEPVETTELVVYSSRIEQLIKPIFDHYTAQTGVQFRYVTDSAGPLLARLKAEGENSPADVLITVDAGNLWQAAQMGVLAPLQSEVLNNNIPAHLRDEEGRWFGLSIRARSIVYASERVDPSELSSYEALADDKWSGRLCLRTSKKVYNQSLVATMIVAHGEAKTEEIVKGWVKNLAVPPFASDNKVIEAIEAGQCDVGLVNTYYLARKKVENPGLPVNLFWANQSGEAPLNRGVHVNISGAGATAASDNQAEVKALLEWLSGPEAQYDVAELNQEFPVNPASKPSSLIASWGDFKADSVPVSEAGRLQADAIRLMDRAGYR